MLLLLRPASWRVWICLFSFAVALPVRAGSDWKRLEADGVVLVSDAGRRDATEFLAGYLAYRQAFTELLLPAGRRPGPVCIILFRDRDDLVECAGADNARLLAATAEVDGEVYLALSVDGDRKEALRIVYEMDTLFGVRRFGWFLPLWMEQGLGTVFSTLRVTKDGVIVAAPQRDYAGVAQGRDWLPWGMIGEMVPGSPAYQAPAGLAAFLGQSWAAMRAVLLSRPGDTRGALGVLVEAIRQNDAPDEALARALGLERGAVAAELRKVARQATTITVPFDAAAARERIQFAPASELEICLRRASLIQTRPDSDRALVWLLRARELAPRAPAVLEAWARQERGQHNENRAAELYREAVEAGSTNPKAWLFSARQRLNDAMSSGRDLPGGGGVPAQQALDEIRRAMALNPGDGEAYQLMARALFAVEKPTEADLRDVEPGMNSAQFGPGVRYYRALVQQRLGLNEAGATSMRELLALRAVPVLQRDQMLQDFLRIRANWVGQQIRPRVQDGDFAGARALVEQLLNPKEWPTADSLYQTFTEAIAVDEAFEELQLLRREGREEELAKATEAFIARFPRHPMADALQRRRAVEAGEP